MPISICISNSRIHSHTTLSYTFLLITFHLQLVISRLFLRWFNLFDVWYNEVRLFCDTFHPNNIAPMLVLSYNNSIEHNSSKIPFIKSLDDVEFFFVFGTWLDKLPLMHNVCLDLDFLRNCIRTIQIANCMTF